MRNLIPFMVGLLLICSCELGPIEEVATPQNLTIEAYDNGLGIRLSWDMVENAEGYRIYFKPAGENTYTRIDEVTPGSATSYTQDADAIDSLGLGDYYVTAFKGRNESSPSNVVSTIPVFEDGCKIYDLDAPTQVGYSAYNWEADGNGEPRSYNSTDDWDIYLNDGVDGAIDTSKFHIISPDTALQWFQIPPEGVDNGAAYIAEVDDPSNIPSGTSITTKYQPESMDEGIASGDYYVVYMKDEGPFYVLLQITRILDNGIEFDYWFQTIPNFRRFVVQPAL